MRMRAAIALVSAVVLTACNAADAQRGEAEGSGTTVQRNFQVGAFDSVSLGGHHDVVITVGGNGLSVRAEGDQREIDDLEIETRGNELHIGTKRRMNWSGRRRPVTIHIAVPALAAAAIGGSGNIRIDNVQGRQFGASIGGSGNIEIASLRVGEGQFSIAGSGNIRADGGQAQMTEISIAGSGDIDLRGVQSRNAQISVVGSGDVRVRASEAASVTIMGSGDVTVAGQARCTVNKMGSGDVHCEA
jgi:hypothetical protein